MVFAKCSDNLYAPCMCVCTYII